MSVLLNELIENNDIIPNMNENIESKPKQKRCYNRKIVSSFTYEDSFNDNFNIHKYPHKILKQVCKDNKLLVTGNKNVLKGRIITEFKRRFNVIHIQRLMRGWIIRHMNKLRGPALNNRELCVNKTDACSLEPLEEIEPENFYSYIGDNDQIYGFNISSLIHLLHSSNKMYNPYNRYVFTNKQKSSIISLHNLTIYYYRYYRIQNKYVIRPDHIRSPNNRRVSRQRDLVNRITNSVNNQLNSNYNNYIPTIIPNSVNNDVMYRKYQEIIALRQKPLDERVQSLFMEIDQLGNYTNISWFNSLDHLKYARLYRAIFDIWNFHAQISLTVKNTICPFHGPFEGIFNTSIRHIDLTVAELKTICVIVFENLVYSSICIEHRKLGALHALTALTVVSRPAREAMPWLYESIPF